MQCRRTRHPDARYPMAPSRRGDRRHPTTGPSTSAHAEPEPGERMGPRWKRRVALIGSRRSFLKTVKKGFTERGSGCTMVYVSHMYISIACPTDTAVECQELR